MGVPAEQRQDRHAPTGQLASFDGFPALCFKLHVGGNGKRGEPANHSSKRGLGSSSLPSVEVTYPFSV